MSHQNLEQFSRSGGSALWARNCLTASRCDWSQWYTLSGGIGKVPIDILEPFAKAKADEKMKNKDDMKTTKRFTRASSREASKQGATHPMARHSSHEDIDLLALVDAMQAVGLLVPLIRADSILYHDI